MLLKRHSKIREALMEFIWSQRSIQRICNFASSKSTKNPLIPSTDFSLGGFKLYGRRNYEYVKETVEEIKASQDHGLPSDSLRRPYDDKLGVFPSRSVNLGLQSTSFPHTDDKNLAQSWCSVTPLGRFDHRKGGHLALWDLRLAIDFPAGSTILIPSALIVHSNSSIQQGETRFSIVQYAAGGLFRWVDNNHMTTINRKKKMKVEELESEGIAQWERARNMFTKVEELIQR
jgi:hypothetical protein